VAAEGGSVTLHIRLLDAIVVERVWEILAIKNVWETDMTEIYSQPTELVGKRVAEVDETGDLVFNAAVVASLLGLTPDAFMEELRKGNVHQVHERGTGEDSGRTRVTFRYRVRQSILTLDALGRVLDVS
jgi:hypothetical protein